MRDLPFLFGVINLDREAAGGGDMAGLILSKYPEPFLRLNDGLAVGID